MMDFSIIIPCDTGSERREINRWTQDWYRRTYQGHEVVVSTCDEKPFNKARAINSGVLSASSDLLVIADSDTLIFPDQLAKALADDWAIPFDRVLDLSQAATRQWLAQGASIEDVEIAKTRTNFERAGGVWVVSRAIFEAAGGCDERYAGWGGEDDSFCRAANTLVRRLRMIPGDVYHLWHPRNPGRNDFQHRPNYRLWMRYVRATGDKKAMRKIVNETQGRDRQTAGSGVSIVIPYGKPEPTRNQNLVWVEKYYRHFYPQAEVIVSRYTEEPFRKGTAINRGVAKASNQIIALVDADIIVPPAVLDRGIDAVRGGAPTAFPRRHVHNLTRTATKRLRQMTPRQALGSHHDCHGRSPRKSVDGRGGFQVFSKATWEAVGGYDERFQGWGGEDVAFGHATMALCGHGYQIAGDEPHYHLWHTEPQRVVPPGNMELWREYTANPPSGQPRSKAAIREVIDRRTKSSRRVSFLSLAPWYSEHMKPVWDALPEASRGEFVEAFDQRARWRAVTDLNERADVVLVASLADGHVSQIAKPVIRMMHGAGQTYSGSRTRPARNVIAHLVPNESARHMLEARYEQPIYVVGCPKMDALVPHRKNRVPLVAISFHFDLTASTPEERSAFLHYRDVIASVAERYQILGHGHPRMMPMLRPFYQDIGIEVVDDFSDVMARADLYCCDHMSTLYEFAALDKPVVVLNAPWYRRDVEHGLRYWEYADVGLNCDEPENLLETIRAALRDPDPVKAKRHRAIKHVYPFQGEAARVTVDAIMDVLGGSAMGIHAGNPARIVVG